MPAFGEPGRRVGSRPDERPPRRRIARRARGLQALPDRRHGRRHDAAGKAALEARSRRDRRARGTVAATAQPSSRRRTARRRRPRWRPRSSSRAAGSPGTGPAPTSSPGSPPPSSPSATPISACSRSTRARCRRSFAGSGHARCCSATSSATSSIATASSSTSPSAGAQRRPRCPRRPCSWSTATTPRSATWRASARTRSPTGSTIRAMPAPRSSTRPIRATASAAGSRTSSPPPTSGISATTAVRPAVTPGPSCRCARRRSSSTGCTRPRSCSRRPLARHGSGCRFPGLYNVYNALGAAALAQSLGASLEEIRAGLERFGAAFGRFERIPAGDKTLLVLLIKNPAGANEVVHTLLEGGAPSLLLVALNDAIADGKDVSWIWDVDFEPLLARSERLIASGDRAAELGAALRLRRAAGGRARRGAVARPRARPRARADRRRRRARRPPHVHGDARAAADRRRARLVEAVLGARREDPGRPPLSRVPQHLRRPRQHRGARAAGSAPRPRVRGGRRSPSATMSTPARTISSTSAAVRTASRR